MGRALKSKNIKKQIDIDGNKKEEFLGGRGKQHLDALDDQIAILKANGLDYKSAQDLRDYIERILDQKSKMQSKLSKEKTIDRFVEAQAHYCGKYKLIAEESQKLVDTIEKAVKTRSKQNAISVIKQAVQRHLKAIGQEVDFDE